MASTTPQLIDTLNALSAFLGELPPCSGPRPDLYLDLEGNDLCRSGTLSLVTIFVESRGTVHLVDVTKLRGEAFSTSDAAGRSLKSILESPDIIKVFFDIRNDSDALFSHYRISVRGIEDVQLLELATRNASSRRLLSGLAKCIGGNSDIESRDRHAWSRVKERGQQLFRSGTDGYAVFVRRPLSADILEYCVQDVTFLPKLRDSYRTKLCNASWRKIEEETLARIVLSQSSGFNGKGRHMSLGPTHWQHWSPSLAERRERSMLIDEEPAVGTAEHPEASSPARAQPSEDSPDHLAQALQAAMHHRSPSPETRYDSDDYGGAHFGGYRSSLEESNRDYTACDIECGYCGHCDY